MFAVAGVSIGNETATASNYNEPEPEPTTTAPLHVNNQQLVRAEQHNNENHSTENDNNENSTRILESEGSLVTQEIWGGGEASDNTTTTGTEIQSSTSGIVYTPGGTMQINGTQYIVVDKSEEITLSRTKRRKSKIRNSRKRVYSHEYYIKRMLLRDQDYDKTTRPVKNDSATTTVYVGMSLYHILDTVSVYFMLYRGDARYFKGSGSSQQQACIGSSELASIKNRPLPRTILAGTGLFRHGKAFLIFMKY